MSSNLFPVIIVGDFNLPDIKWPNVCSASSTSLSFVDAMFSLGYQQNVDFPTHGENFLSLCFSSDSFIVFDTKLLPPFCHSDNPPHCTLGFSINLPLRNISSRSKRDFARANYNQIVDYMHSIDWQYILSDEDVDLMVSNFYDVTNRCIEYFIPVISSRKYRQPKAIRFFNNKKKHLWNLWRETGSDHHKSLYLTSAKEYRTAVASHDNQLAQRLCDSNNIGAFYRFTRARMSARSSIPPIRDDIGNLVSNPSGKVEIFAKHFHENFNNEFISRFPECLGPPSYDEFSLICENSVLGAISKLSSSDSCGPDGIPSTFVKGAALGLVEPLSIIFRHCFLQSVFPKIWRSARVFPVFKKGNPSEPDNYRPVSVTSPFPKVMEKILGSFLLMTFLESDGFCDFQHGFLPGRSSDVNLLQSFDTFTLALENEGSVDTVFLDYSRAFDKVHHSSLCKHLIDLHISPIIIRFISTFIQDRTQYISLEGSISSNLPVNSGVMQGTILSTILFSIFINSLCSSTSSSEMILFADDVKLIADPSLDGALSLQHDLDSVLIWSHDNLLPISMEKSVVLHLGRNNPGNPYYLKECELKCVDHVRDLGITYDSSLNFSLHFSDIVERAHKRAYLLRHCLAKCTNFFKIKAFLTYVRPVLEYGSSVWNPVLVKDIVLIESVQRRFTRFLPGFHGVSYENRLRSLGIQTLERRRLILDLCLMYRMVYNIVFVSDSHPLITVLPPTRSRSHDRQILIPSVKNTKRFNFFSLRTARIWNTLPSEIVKANSLAIFKTKIHELDLSPFLIVHKF